MYVHDPRHVLRDRRSGRTHSILDPGQPVNNKPGGLPKRDVRGENSGVTSLVESGLASSCCPQALGYRETGWPERMDSLGS